MSLDQPFADLQEWWDRERLQFITDLIDVMAANEKRDGNGNVTDGGFTFQEIRDLMEAYFDKEYDPDMRHLECQPTQRQVNRGIEELLATDNGIVAYEHENRVFLHHDDIAERKMMARIVEIVTEGPESA